MNSLSSPEKYLPKKDRQYQLAVKYIFDRLPMFHRVGAAAYKNNLDNTLALSSLTGQPEQKFPAIHIAGTNGKGSVAHMLASVLQEAGYKTGLFTSPHLKNFRERIRVNGEKIAKNHVIKFIENYEKQFERLEPSFFEIMFAMAMDYFADQKVDFAVVEAGMGGRLDSTNIVNPILSIITNISYDHMQFLGDTLPDIATEKAGIIKPQVPVLIGKTQRETADLFRITAQKQQSPITFADSIYQTREFSFALCGQFGSTFKMEKNRIKLPMHYFSQLAGNYQQENLQTVFAARDLLNESNLKISEEALFDGIANAITNTGLKGRWQVIKRLPLTIADTAHNEAGIAWVMEQIGGLKFSKLHIVLGMVADKEITGMLKLLPDTASYYFCQPNIPRGLDRHQLAQEAEHFGLIGATYSSVGVASKAARLASSKNDLVIITGSTFVVAEVV